MDQTASFGYWVRRRRKALDLTQAVVAKRVGCALITIQKIEADERRPSTQIAARLADCFQLAVDEHAAFLRFARGESSAQWLMALPVSPVSLPCQQPHYRSPTLPAPSTPLIGRAHDVTNIRTLVEREGMRLLTLVGPPGIGKTRLSLEVAAAVRGAFRDGVHFVPLAAISDAELVIPTIAQALGIPEGANQRLIDRLNGYLAAKQLLLVLDNVEQIISAAPAVGELLAAAAHLTVLATSRVPLHLHGEHQYEVHPLAVPDLQHLPSLEHLLVVDSVRLFVQRAQAARFDFALTAENVASVAALCVRLDGLPLAIELVATGIKTFTPQTLLRRLGHSLDLLIGGAQDRAPRHHTLRNAIAWSHALLTPVERTLFTRLAVFVGGWTLDAAEAVCANDLELEVLPVLHALVDTSLVQRHEGRDGEARYGMLELIREYAGEQLAARGEEAAVRAQHARYYLALGEAAETQLESREAVGWLRRLDMDADNLRAALTWLLAHDPAGGLRLASVFAQFCDSRGYFSEGHKWLAAAIPHASAAPAALRAKALLWATLTAWQQGRAERTLAEESLVLYGQAGDPLGMAWAINTLGLLARTNGEPGRARACWEESLALARTLGNTWGAQSLIAILLLNLASEAADQGDDARARLLVEEGLATARAIGHQRWSAVALNDLGRIALAQGNYTQAQVRFEESMMLAWEWGDERVVVESLENMALLVYTQAQDSEATPRAMRLFGAAAALRDVLNAPLFAMLPNSDSRIESTLAALRTQGDPTTWTTWWGEGRAMTLEQAMAYARDGLAADQ